jgi:hypothetical protein
VPTACAEIAARRSRHARAANDDDDDDDDPDDDDESSVAAPPTEERGKRDSSEGRKRRFGEARLRLVFARWITIMLPFYGGIFTV